MSKDVLTQKVIESCIGGTDGGRQNAKIALILAIVMFVLGAAMLFWPLITLILWGIGVLALVLRAHSLRTIGYIQKKQYALRQDVCINKHISTDSEGTDTRYLIFEKFGRKEMHFPHVVMNSAAFLKTPDVYDATQNGDLVYLLLTPKGKVLYIFNCRFWELDATEFSQTEDLFLPL